MQEQLRAIGMGAAIATVLSLVAITGAKMKPVYSAYIYLGCISTALVSAKPKPISKEDVTPISTDIPKREEVQYDQHNAFPASDVIEPWFNYEDIEQKQLN